MASTGSGATVLAQHPVRNWHRRHSFSPFAPPGWKTTKLDHITGTSAQQPSRLRITGVINDVS
jgi:hypothetical protein